MLSIKKAAALSGLTPKALRLYDQAGLVPARRGANQYRYYTQSDLEALRFVQHCRQLGFSLPQCRELLQLQQDPNRASREVKQVAQAHLDQLDAQLAQLQRMRDWLQQRIEQCPGDQRSQCAILRGLTEPGGP